MYLAMHIGRYQPDRCFYRNKPELLYFGWNVHLQNLKIIS